MAKGGRRAHAGRPRKPTSLKVVQGTFRDDRHGEETTAPVAFPKAPKGLTSAERASWKVLEGLCGSWTAESDVFALQGVVALYDLLQRNRAAMQASMEAGAPLSFKYTITQDGEGDDEKHVEVEPKENPLYTQQVKIWRELRAYIAITGLSPVDRAKVKPAGDGEPEKLSPLQDLIKRGRR